MKLCFKVSPLKKIFLNFQLRDGNLVVHDTKTWPKNTQFKNEIGTLSSKMSHLQVEIEFPQKEDKGVQLLLGLSVSSDSRVPLFILNSTSNKENSTVNPNLTSTVFYATRQNDLIFGKPADTQPNMICFRPTLHYICYFWLYDTAQTKYSPF